MLEQLYNEKETAKLLSLSVKTLQRYRYTGGGPIYVKLGKSVRYKESDIAKYVSVRTRNITTEQ